MALLSQALHLGYLLSPHRAFQGHAAHTARWPAMLSPNGSSATCIADGVFHIPMPCFHGALPVYPKVFPHSSTSLSRRTATQERKLLAVACRPWFGEVLDFPSPDSIRLHSPQSASPFGLTSNAACDRKKHTSNAMKKFTWPRIIGTSVACVQANAKSTGGNEAT